MTDNKDNIQRLTQALGCY